MIDEYLASNAICLYENQGEEELCKFLCKLSFSQLIEIRDSILSGHTHFTNRAHDLIIKAIRAILLDDLSICPELELYLRRYI